MRRRRWLSAMHFKGRRLPKTWRWETDKCAECDRPKARYKVYASWYVSPTMKEIEKTMRKAQVAYDKVLEEHYKLRGGGYISNLSAPEGM